MDVGEAGSSSQEMDVHPPHHDPKECLKLRPKKGILKSTSSFDEEAAALPEKRRHSMSNKEARFDEMNVIATHHPPNKDYGHMKVEEPKTPYHYYSDSDGEEQGDRMRRVSLSEKKKEIDPQVLKEAILEGKDEELKVLAHPLDSSTEEEQEAGAEQHRSFEMKRKQHYNEYQNIKLAKKLIEEDLKEIEKEEENITGKEAMT